MQKSLDNLIALLDLEELEVNIFRGRCTEGWQRVFGGQVLGQALVAAGRTVAQALDGASQTGPSSLPRSHNPVSPRTELDLVDVRVNCDQNSLLYRVRPRNRGVCHTRDSEGRTRPTCYYRRVEDEKRLSFV